MNDTLAPSTHAPLLTIAAMARTLGMRCTERPSRKGEVCECGQPATMTLVTDYGVAGCCAGGAQ